MGDPRYLIYSGAFALFGACVLLAVFAIWPSAVESFTSHEPGVAPDCLRTILGTLSMKSRYVRHALAGCVTTTLVYHAAARGVGSRRSAPRCGWRASDEQLRDVVEFARAHSPVFDIVTTRVPVSVQLA